MKTVFINVPGGETKTEKALELAKLLFNQNELAWVEYDSQFGMKAAVRRMLECDYYISIDGIWGFKEGRERDRITDVAYKLFDDYHRYCAPIKLFFTEEELNELMDHSGPCDEVNSPRWEG